MLTDPMMRHGDGCVLPMGHDGDCAPPPPTLETPKVFANRPAVWCLLYPALAGSVARDMAASIARYRDKQIAAKVRRLAEAAEHEAAAHPSPERVARCEGQASAFRAMAAMLERL